MQQTHLRIFSADDAGSEPACEAPMEKQAERQMVERRDGVAARLQGVHSAAEASHAYAASSLEPLSRPTLCDES